MKRNFRRICHELKFAEGDKFVTKYPDFDQNLNSLTEKFKVASEKLGVIKKINFENDPLGKQEERENQKKRNDLMSCASNLHFEIKIRYETFHRKCSVEVDNLDDFEVLELEKHKGDFHLELRELRFPHLKNLFCL